MKNLILSLVVLCFCSLPVYGAFPTVGSGNMADYCFVPPYLTQNAKPNINIVLDVSGSMQEPAYRTCTGSSLYSGYVRTCNATSGANLYDSGKDYFGYFDNTQYYKYTTGSNYFEVNSNCTSDPNRRGNITNGCLSGNLLNWIVTTREDTIRKILTGGRIKSGTTNVLESDGASYAVTDTSLYCKFNISATNNVGSTSQTTYSVNRTITITNSNSGTCSNVTKNCSKNSDCTTWSGTGTCNPPANPCSLGTLTTAASTNVLANDVVKGVVQDLYDQAALEFSVFAGSDADYRVAKGQTLPTYVSSINSELAYNGTPTGTAMKQAKAFFQQDNSILTSSNATLVSDKGNYTKDPYYDSDGAATPSSLPVPCRKSFVLLISDGMWPSGSYTAYTTVNSEDPVQYAHTMRKSDMRTGTGFDTSPMDKQVVTTYVVYAYGDGVYGRNSLIATAIFGGYDDKSGNGWPYPFTALPTDSRSDAATGNTTPYALSRCNPAGTWDAGCAEWDKDKTGLPFNYFEGDDGAALQQQIKKAVTDILTRASSGTAASMLGNSDSSGATMLQALFFPEKQFTDSTKAQWLGEVQAFWYYLDSSLNSSKVTLREDTVHNYKLKLTEDRIARFVFNGTDTKVRLFVDTDGDGVEDNPASYEEDGTDEVSALWRAGLTLWSRLPDDATEGRVVYTNDLNATPAASKLMRFSTANISLLKSKLDIDTADNVDATNVINYTLGRDPDNAGLTAGEKSTALSGYRSRTVKIGTSTHVWKLGDIINSTPRMISPTPLNIYNAGSPGGYRDMSYNKFVSTLGYKNRGVAFVGANDGMLHAFKMGKTIRGGAGYVSRVVDTTDLNGNNPVEHFDLLGKELWSYIPKNVLPYLKHRGNPSYGNAYHLYYVDSTPTIFDASIGIVSGVCSNDHLKGCSNDTECGSSPVTCNTVSPACTGADCPKVDTSWRTVLIGSMGLGGATRDSTATCTNCVKTPVSGIGYSSYFALDVTDQASPKLLWEFSDPGLGFSTVGPAIVRIRDASDATTGFSQKNGKFYAVFASGPTGPISGNQMEGFSDQPLNIYVLDLRTGQVVQTFSNSATSLISGVSHKQVAAMPSFAFGGAFSGSTIDTDKWDIKRTGNYSDDAIYLGYVRKDSESADVAHGLGKFSKGGVLRILTGDDPVPANWTISQVIDGTGPVTSAVSKLQDTYKKKLWLFFGTGRYFYKYGSTIDEDYPYQNEAIYGIMEPCYSVDTTVAKLNDMDASCTTTVHNNSTDLQDQSGSASSFDLSKKGWKINLGVASGDYKAKRIYTNPTATSNGVVFFTAFKPSTAVCSYGGDTSLWAVLYSSGGSVAGRNLKGQAMMQLATGELKQIDLATAFTNSGNRESDAFKGPPSKDETQITSNANHFPVKKVLHIMER